MKLGKYESYKDSGIKWLPQIPEEWVVKRIKDLTVTKSGTTPSSGNPKYYENGIHNWIRTTDLNNSHLYDVEYKITDLALEECRLSFLPLESILVAMYGGFGTIGKNALLKKASTINQSVCAILPNHQKLDSNYILYFLKYFRNDWKIFADGARKDPNINQDAVKNLFILYPPLPEQTQIASYLDRKTEAIDKKVALLQAKITKYQELKKALINQTVCRGLNATTPLKDSGINWISQIPEHWEVKRLKDYFDIFTGNSISDKTKFENPDEAIPYVATKDIDFHTGKITYDNGIYIPKTDLSFKRTKADSTLICIEGANAGKKIGFTDKEIAFVNKLCAFKSRNKGNLDKYFYYYTQTNIFKCQFFALINGLIGGVSVSFLKYFDILIPSRKEQKEVVQYLETRLSKIDQIIFNIQTQIAALKELRKTLINDVVTGKLKVSA